MAYDEPAAVEAPPAEADKPRVVTRTRRRSASRPAGPPSGAGTVPTSGLVEPGTAGLEPGSGTQAGAVDARADALSDTSSGGPGEASTVEHVPIKKKGSRKR